MAWLSAHRDAVVMVVIAVLVIAAIVALWYVLRQRRKREPEAAKTPSLVAAWSAFLRSLERSARGRPVAWVVGPSGSGKTSLLTRGSLGDRVESVASDHPSVNFYAVRGWLVIELAWEAFRDLRADAVAQRDALVRACAWQSNALVVVLDASNPLSRDALGALGEQVGLLSARIEQQRRSPVSVRVCWTHLDVEFSGFEPLSAAIAGEHQELEGSQHRVLSVPISAPMSTGEARAAFEPVASLWPYALRGAAFRDVLAFCSRGHERLTGPLVAFSNGVARKARDRAAALDGVSLASLPPSGPSTEMGDVLRADEAQDAALRRSRWLAWGARLVASLALAAVLGALFLMLDRRASTTVDEVERSAQTFSAISRTARGPALDTDATRAANELRSARALSASPRYRAASEQFIEAVQRGYLRPLAQQSDPSLRAIGVALLRSSPGDATRRQIAAQTSAWSERASIPEPVLAEYLALRPGPTDVGVVSPPQSAAAAWTQFERALSATIEPPSLERAAFEEAKRQAATVASIEAASGEDRATRALIESLRAAGEPVDRWFAPASASDAAAMPASRALIAAVAGGDLSTPVPSQPTLASLLRATEPLAATLETDSADAATGSSPAAAQPVVGDAGGASSDASAAPPSDPRLAQWNRALARFRSASALDAWLASRRQSTDPMATFFVAGECGAPFGQSVVAGRGASQSIPCELDPTVYSSAVVRPRAQLSTMLRPLALPAARESELTTFVTTEATALETMRSRVLQQYVERFAFRCDGVEILAGDFATIVGPGSYLRSYLSTIAKVLSGVDVSLQGEYASLAAIGATNAAGATPVLDPFLEILRPMMASLSSLRPIAAPPNTPLAQRTAPIGALALSMLQGGETSPWTKASAWLDAQGVSPRLRRPMMAPIECAYQLGISEAERVLAQIYGREMAPSVRRQWARFPFDSSADQEADPAEVESLFAPNGTFWAGVEANFSTVAEATAAGRWRGRRGPNGREFALPPGSACSLTRATRTKSALFTADGARAPLALDVHSAPLPLSTSGFTPTLVTLRAGQRSISAFNQAEIWQRLAVGWGDGGNSGLVVHLLPVGGGASQIVTMDRGPSDWSFHRLLSDGDNTMSRSLRRVVTWSVRAPNGAAVRLEFEFRSDPWLPFLAPSGCEAPQ